MKLSYRPPAQPPQKDMPEASDYPFWATSIYEGNGLVLVTSKETKIIFHHHGSNRAMDASQSSIFETDMLQRYWKNRLPVGSKITFEVE
jgi:hypothetical protein